MQGIFNTATPVQDLGPPDETMQPAELADASTSIGLTGGSVASQTPTVPINWAEVSYITGVAQNGSLTNASYWGFNGETARRWMNGTSATTGPAGGPGGTVTYYFDTASNWSPAEQASFVGGLDLWSAIANIRFAPAATETSADVVFYRGHDGSAFTSTPAYDGSGSSLGRIAGDFAGSQYQSEISIDTSQASWSHLDSFSLIGGYGISTIIHEEGHLIGLGHAGPYNGTVNTATQQNSAYDTRLWSGMSYIRPEDTTARFYSSYPVTGTSWGTTSDHYYRAPYTPMPLDILAAQQLYGVATNTPLSGGQIFGFNCNILASTGIRSYFDFTVDTSPVVTLYDAGLNNTLDLSGYSTTCTVDLRDGHFSSVAGLTNNIAIAYGTQINNAIGGTNNDTFQVNPYNDYINGGAGTDVVTFLGNRSDYTIARNTDGLVAVIDSNTSRGGRDELANIETLRFADQSVAVSSLPVVAASPPALFGTITHDPRSLGGEVYLIYDGLLGRAPDPLGLEYWVSRVQSGDTLPGITAGFLSSPEFTSDYGPYLQISAQAFVTDIYENVLHRAPDSGGLQYWTGLIAGGRPREFVADDIVISPEHQSLQQSVFDAGLFVPNATDAAIARLYYALVDRPPDAAGLQGWETSVAQGTSLQTIAQSLINSSEYQALHGQQTNQQFVDAMYQDVFGSLNPAAEQGFVNELTHGTSRAAVAVEFAQNSDVAQHLVPNIEVGFRLG